jgi:hypothetical protein
VQYSVPAGWHWLAQTTSRHEKPPSSLKSFDECDHEIMQNGITGIFLNLVETM